MLKAVYIMVAKTLYDYFMVCDKSMFIGSQQCLGKQNKKNIGTLSINTSYSKYIYPYSPQGGEVTCSPVICPSATCAKPDAPAPGQCCHTCQGV